MRIPMVRTNGCHGWRNVFLLVLCLLPSHATSLMAQSTGPSGPNPYGRLIREIRIEGLRITRESAARDQLASQVGHLYTEETAQDDLRWLDRLGVFSSIQAKPVVIQDEVILTIEVQELPRILPYPSANISDESGFSIGIGARIPSLLQRAIAFSGSTRFGGGSETEVSTHTPWKLRRREWFGAKYNYRNRANKMDSFRENSHELEVRIGIGLRQNWRLSGRFGFMSLGSDTSGITLSSDNRDNTPALGAVLEYDGRDLPSNPHSGWETIFDISQSGGFLGGDGDFVTTQFDIRRYQPLAARHVLAFFSYATFQTGSVGETVPVYRDYKIGGKNSVRGWKKGARRGNNQFLNTLEYRFELFRPRSFRIHSFGFYAGLQLVAFGDLGTAWDQGSEFTGNMIAAGGFGLHVLVPFVERIRIEFGFGQSGAGMLSHFGVREKANYSRRRVR